MTIIVKTETLTNGKTRKIYLCKNYVLKQRVTKNLTVQEIFDLYDEESFYYNVHSLATFYDRFLAIALLRSLQ